MKYTMPDLPPHVVPPSMEENTLNLTKYYLMFTLSMNFTTKTHNSTT